MLQVIQPGLDGWMDGSASTLAPLFAAAFATHNSWAAFLVGLAISVGGGISMALAEALSDNGVITGRGMPWVRGGTSGIGTLIGGILPTGAFLLPNIHDAINLGATVAAFQLCIISWVRHRYQEIPMGKALLQTVAGGVLVLVTGILIGGS